MSLADLTSRLAAGNDLHTESVAEAAAALLAEEGESVEARADFLKALAEKGETPEEIALFVEAFLAEAVVPPLAKEELPWPLIDVCGTGGDKLDLFNVSTTAMFLLPPGGLGVVKHGNRSITSKSGGADVLEALGVPIDLPPDLFSACVREHGLAFLFAPLYHPAFKAVGPVRAKLAEEGRRTVFNILGPLLNPVRPDHQVVGVFDDSLPPVFARILDQLGRKSAWAVHGRTADGRGVDELSTMGPTRVAQLKDGEITEFTVEPGDHGLAVADVGDLRGGDAQENAAILRAILAGEERGPKRDIVLLNAGAAFVAGGVATDLAAGIERARVVIDDGSALACLEAVVGYA